MKAIKNYNIILVLTSLFLCSCKSVFTILNKNQLEIKSSIIKSNTYISARRVMVNNAVITIHGGCFVVNCKKMKIKNGLTFVGVNGSQTFNVISGTISFGNVKGTSTVSGFGRANANMTINTLSGSLQANNMDMVLPSVSLTGINYPFRARVDTAKIKTANIETTEELAIINPLLINKAKKTKDSLVSPNGYIHVAGNASGKMTNAQFSSNSLNGSISGLKLINNISATVNNITANANFKNISAKLDNLTVNEPFIQYTDNTSGIGTFTGFIQNASFIAPFKDTAFVNIICKKIRGSISNQMPSGYTLKINTKY